MSIQIDLTKQLPIKLVVATRFTQQQFLSESLTGRSLFKFLSASKAQIQIFANNTTGLGELYNSAIEMSIDDPCILVFVHDDVLISDYFWTERVRNGLGRFDIVGIAGNTRRINNQPSWIIKNTAMELDDPHHLSGAIGQGQSFPPEKLDVFGPLGKECKLMDGVFLAVSSETLKISKLRFDPSFAFHFYDLDFCRLAEKLNLKMGTIPLSLVHGSYGKLDESWQLAYEKYIEKWGN